MKKLHPAVWSIVIALLLIFTMVHAAEWVKLGGKLVRHSVDRDVILVGADEGTFTAIKMTVKRAGIHLLDMKVHFVNGDVFDVQVRKLIPRAGETRVIDLPGKNRRIEKVVFWYKTPKTKAMAAKIRLWARR